MNYFEYHFQVGFDGSNFKAASIIRRQTTIQQCQRSQSRAPLGIDFLYGILEQQINIRMKKF